MKRPSNIQKFKPVDPKLGIKSSLPKSKSTIALVILLWLSNDKKYEIEYSETDGDKITISENCYDKLIQYLRNNIDIKGDSEEDIMNYVSEYPIATSEDIKTYLLENLDCLKGKNIDDLTEEEREKYFEMRIPANMYIWATMNSADQGVFPMDTAFKRRWEFEYLSVNDDEQVAAIKDYVIPMCIKDNKADHYIGWDSLRTRINNILTSEKCKVNEDKLLGPFFISKNMLDEIKNNKEQVDELEAKDEAYRTEKDNEALKDMHQKENSYIKAFESKVIMYLFEDVMKMRPENIFIGHHKKNGKMIFSEICKAFEQDGEGIFGIEDLENI